jgi:hypothetical protein
MINLDKLKSPPRIPKKTFYYIVNSKRSKRYGSTEYITAIYSLSTNTNIQNKGTTYTFCDPVGTVKYKSSSFRSHPSEVFAYLCENGFIDDADVKKCGNMSNDKFYGYYMPVYDKDGKVLYDPVKYYELIELR